MTGKAKAAKGRIKATGLVRDKHGNPKVEKHLLDKFWSVLTEDDKAYLRQRYPNYGNHSS